MIEFQTDKISFLYTNKSNWITLRTDNVGVIEQLPPLTDENTYDVTIKKHKEKRSLNANAYCWVLLDKLSEKLNIPSAELYRETIRNIGGVSDRVTIKFEALDKFAKAWNSQGLGWQVITDTNDLAGYVDCQCFYGSSTYNTAQMSRLLDLIVQECKEQEIETKTPQEIENLKSLWSEHEKHNSR